jgi:RNA-binding protein
MNTTLKKQLKSQAHHLSPVVLMGAKGLTDALIAECDLALTTHELIKIKIVSADKEEKAAITTALCQATDAELVQTIGHIVVLYRQNLE